MAQATQTESMLPEICTEDSPETQEERALLVAIMSGIMSSALRVIRAHGAGTYRSFEIPKGHGTTRKIEAPDGNAAYVRIEEDPDLREAYATFIVLSKIKKQLSPLADDSFLDEDHEDEDDEDTAWKSPPL